MPAHHPFVGREQEVAELGGILSQHDTKVVCVEGESGTGKTALVSAVLNGLATRGRIAARVFLARAGHVRGIEEWLLTELATSLLGSFPPHATASELRQLIIESAATSDLVIAIDNAESLDHEWSRHFISQWLVAVPRSQLLLTTTRVTPLDDAGYQRYPLGGLRAENDEAILDLLGPDLQSRFDRTTLLPTAARLRNLPQKLLYLRWLDPLSNDDLRRVADDLTKEGIGQELIDGMRKRTRGFIGHYLALGHVRSLRFEEDLLAALWDRLGGGSAQAYVIIRDRLLQEGLLARTSEAPDDRGLRVSPSVHVQLERELASSLGRPHLPHVDYFLSEYFRRRFEESSDASLQYLSQYIYHSGHSGNLRPAAEYILASDRLEALRRQGLTVPLRRVLLALYDEIDRELDGQRERRSDDVILQCRSALEVAASECDLSDYDKSLITLDNVLNTLTALPHGSVTARLRRRANILRGISLGCLGRLEECIRSYLAVVANALDGNGVDSEAVEALGYAAMVVSYIDMPRAVALGEHGLRLARVSADRGVLAKNSCSLAQTLLFAGRVVEAANLLAAAEDYCRGENGTGDRHELGRVLIPKALTVMLTEGGRAALPIAAEAVTVNAELGDRRRHARARIASALATLSAGDNRIGRKMLAEALERLHSSQDWLNLVLAALTYAYIDGISDVDAVLSFVRSEGRSEPWVPFVIEAISRSNLITTITPFWQKQYIPFLRSAQI